VPPFDLFVCRDFLAVLRMLQSCNLELNSLSRETRLQGIAPDITDKTSSYTRLSGSIMVACWWQSCDNRQEARPMRCISVALRVATVLRQRSAESCFKDDFASQQRGHVARTVRRPEHAGTALTMFVCLLENLIEISSHIPDFVQHRCKSSDTIRPDNNRRTRLQ
jgi:hypothetical protein